MKSRIKIISVCLLVVLSLGSLFYFYGYNSTWGLWNVPTMSPHFADIRVITGGAESYAQGLDPMIENPGDPWQRRLNYPRIWQSLYSFGIDQSHTTAIGVTFILLFLIGVCLILPYPSPTAIVLATGALLSPAILLGVERGNIDLLVFFITSVSIVTAQRWHGLSVVAIVLGFTLKLYPIFGCMVLFRLRQSLFFRYMGFMFVFGLLYGFLNYTDILMIREGTPKSEFLSYGLNVFWVNGKHFNITTGTAKFITLLVLFFTMGFAISALLRDGVIHEQQDSGVSLDAFRSGSAIYLGTFLLGNNWDYRLMFLILTIPQLVAWIKYPNRNIAIGATIVLLSEFLSLWYLMIARLASYFPYGAHVSFLMDELFNWITFVGLLYLLFWSLPRWAKELVKKNRLEIS